MFAEKLSFPISFNIPQTALIKNYLIIDDLLFQKYFKQGVKPFRGPKILEYRTKWSENIGQNPPKMQKYGANPVVT